MFLCYANTLMSKQSRHTLEGHAGIKQRDGECVAEPVAMSVSNLRFLENAVEASPPNRDRIDRFSVSTPEEILRIPARECLKRIHYGIREQNGDVLPSFRLIEA